MVRRGERCHVPFPTICTVSIKIALDGGIKQLGGLLNSVTIADIVPFKRNH
jgi:hypothetical protein